MKKFLRILGMIVLIAIAGGIIAVFGYYREEALSYIAVQGWNLGQYKTATEQLIKAAATGKDDGVGKFVSSGQRGFLIDREGGKIVGFTTTLSRDPEKWTLQQIAPKDTAELQAPKLDPLSGEVSVVGSFADQMVDYRWRSSMSGPQLTNLRVTRMR